MCYWIGVRVKAPDSKWVATPYEDRERALASYNNQKVQMDMQVVPPFTAEDEAEAVRYLIATNPN
jgi:hypothetical protein